MVIELTCSECGGTFGHDENRSGPTPSRCSSCAPVAERKWKRRYDREWHRRKGLGLPTAIGRNARRRFEPEPPTSEIEKLEEHFREAGLLPIIACRQYLPGHGFAVEVRLETTLHPTLEDAWQELLRGLNRYKRPHDARRHRGERTAVKRT